MNKKSKAEKWIILETTIGCLFSLAGSVVFFYFGRKIQESGDDATWVFFVATAFVLIIPITIFLVYKRYFRR